MIDATDEDSPVAVRYGIANGLTQTGTKWRWMETQIVQGTTRGREEYYRFLATAHCAVNHDGRTRTVESVELGRATAIFPSIASRYPDHDDAYVARLESEPEFLASETARCWNEHRRPRDFTRLPGDMTC